jgi:hypothetical protein
VRIHSLLKGVIVDSNDYNSKWDKVRKWKNERMSVRVVWIHPIHSWVLSLEEPNEWEVIGRINDTNLSLTKSKNKSKEKKNQISFI